MYLCLHDNLRSVWGAAAEDLMRSQDGEAGIESNP